jgi:hypothetical protein
VRGTAGGLLIRRARVDDNVMPTLSRPESPDPATARGVDDHGPEHTIPFQYDSASLLGTLADAWARMGREGIARLRFDYPRREQ